MFVIYSRNHASKHFLVMTYVLLLFYTIWFNDSTATHAHLTWTWLMILWYLHDDRQQKQITLKLANSTFLVVNISVQALLSGSYNERVYFHKYKARTPAQSCTMRVQFNVTGRPKASLCVDKLTANPNAKIQPQSFWKTGCF